MPVIRKYLDLDYERLGVELFGRVERRGASFRLDLLS